MGPGVGNVDGRDDGWGLGGAEGIGEGTKEGRGDGKGVGMTLGFPEGRTVGKGVGAAVGGRIAVMTTRPFPPQPTAELNEEDVEVAGPPPNPTPAT